MSPSLLAIGTALWLGVLNAIAPCRITSNVAALGFLARQVSSRRRALVAGILYTAGCLLAYAGTGAVAVLGLASIEGLSLVLQRGFGLALGPLLVLVGMVMLDLIPLPTFGTGGGRLQQVVARWRTWAALPLGALLALSFCPVTAATFFGMLIPLAVRHQSPVALPLAFGLGAAGPVAVFGVLVALATGKVGAAFNRLQAVERWVRRATGAAFILAGIVYSLLTVYNLEFI